MMMFLSSFGSQEQAQIFSLFFFLPIIQIYANPHDINSSNFKLNQFKKEIKNGNKTHLKEHLISIISYY